MALKGKAASDWKAKNFNMGVRVSEQTVQQLRAGKTFENNVASYKKSGGNSQTLEAMNRFYGKARVSSALGTGASTKANNAMTGIKASNVGPNFKGVSTNGYKAATSKGKTVAATGNTRVHNPGINAGSAGRFIKNELLGVDDFSKLRSEMKGHQWMKMAKSIGEGSLELGTTIAAVAAAAPTGGASLAARTAVVAGKQTGKAVIKGASKQALKNAAKSTSKKVATQSMLKTGIGTAKVAGKVVASPIKGVKYAKGAYNAARPAVALAHTPAGRTAARTAENAAKATQASRDAAKAYKALKATKKGNQAVKGLGSAHDVLTSAGAANKAARTGAANAAKRFAAQQAAQKAAKQVVRKGAKKALVVRGVGASRTAGNRKTNNK